MPRRRRILEPTAPVPRFDVGSKLFSMSFSNALSTDGEPSDAVDTAGVAGAASLAPPALLGLDTLMASLLLVTGDGVLALLSETLLINSLIGIVKLN